MAKSANPPHNYVFSLIVLLGFTCSLIWCAPPDSHAHAVHPVHPEFHSSGVHSHESAADRSVPRRRRSVSENRYRSGSNTDEVAAAKLLKKLDTISGQMCRKSVLAEWTYTSNITEHNKEELLKIAAESAKVQKESWMQATSFAWKGFSDPMMVRWFKSLSILGTMALPEDKYSEFTSLTADMESIYSSAKICPCNVTRSSSNECNLSLEPEMTRLLADVSVSYEEKKCIWKRWRDESGKKMRQKFEKYVELLNEAAQMNGFSDAGEMWREAYESETFVEDIENLWKQLKPMYRLLHAYVRQRLRQHYGEDLIKERGPIPAHILGNMWAQTWSNIGELVLPFKSHNSSNKEADLQRKGYSIPEMFKLGEEFFVSLGFDPLPQAFWNNSIFEKPADGREMTCHASAWDMCDGKDVRIKMCTEINMEDLRVIHHELGHIFYFRAYKDQPHVFREGANPGFHEAIGDAIALSFSTPQHLKAINLTSSIPNDREGVLNHLMSIALDKIAFLPTGLLMDLWRWKVFSGEITPQEYNRKWWELRYSYQGVCPPVERSEQDFDPAAKYHIAANVPYIRYFVSFVIQFQFHKAMCQASGYEGPLHQCDIYRSREAGQLLNGILSRGSSEPWMEALKLMTGSETGKMDAGPLLEYFEPLMEYMRSETSEDLIGWESDDPMVCP
ncbi:angiotensin-converting enzyme-like [Brevipalpus obovatus]|uniref:angiotensin-converting enzyme-like n=1 Tax=Brevipalpus obovatus TaxID=246614 RepID=UPI003D9DBE85